MLRRRNPCPPPSIARPVMRRSGPEQTPLPQWIRPQLTQLVDAAPEGNQWLHEIKFDGFRMHARLDHGVVRLLTRTGLDWTHKYPAVANAVASLGERQAYLDGELCGVFPDGVTSFGMIQAASDACNAAGLVYFIFDLLHLDGDDVGALPLIERKARLATLLSGVAPPLHYSDYHRGQGPAFHDQACKLALEGTVSKRADAAYAPGNRGLWLKVKRLHREEFVVVGWIPKAGGLISARCCSPISIRAESWSMPATLAAASRMLSWNGCGEGCSRWRCRRCRSRSRRGGATASDRRWSSAACIG
jgi:ATP-dependent DNA ligase